LVISFDAYAVTRIQESFQNVNDVSIGDEPPFAETVRTLKALSLLLAPCIPVFPSVVFEFIHRRPDVPLAFFSYVSVPLWY
jgi:hypothetical protein